MSAHLNPPTIQQSLIVGPAVLARIVVGADGEPSSIPTLGAEGAQIDLSQYDAAYPHRAPHRIAALVEDGAAAPVNTKQPSTQRPDVWAAWNKVREEARYLNGHRGLGALLTAVEAYADARAQVPVSAAAPTAPTDKALAGWQVHAKDMERDRDYWRQRAETMRAHQERECWYWQGYGLDHPESMEGSLPVVIRADQLRALMAAPQAHQPGADDASGDPRDLFETVYPMPASGCIRCGDGYAATAFNAWTAHNHIERWNGWKAALRAARASAQAQQPDPAEVDGPEVSAAWNKVREEARALCGGRGLGDLLAAVEAYAAAAPQAPAPAPAGLVTAAAYDRLQALANSQAARILELTAPPAAASDPTAPFQQRVHPWLLACFGELIAGDREERNHRFLEESLELVQSTGCTASEAHQLVNYVFGRPVGEPAQEVGGVMVTLAALCLANGLDMHDAGEVELARIWTNVEAIRAKQAAKPKHSPLPEFGAAPAKVGPTNEELFALHHQMMENPRSAGINTFARMVLDRWGAPTRTLQDGVSMPHTTWPVSRDVGRIGDMSPSAHLRVGLDSDNDVYVSVWSEEAGASVEFCNGGGGGGQSLRTREALIALMVAMEEDNAKRPDRDWWRKRNGAPQAPAPHQPAST